MILNSINKYLGWRNWAVFQYNSVFENLFIIFYIILLNQHSSISVIVDVLVFGIFSILSTSYGYLINDYADRELDAKHGKLNTFSQDSDKKTVAVIGIIFVLSFISAIPFFKQPYFIGLWIVWFLLSTFYSLPPLRLKERGKIGLISVVSAQRLLPILMVFSVFPTGHGWFLILAGVYVGFRGLSSDLNHQVEDFKNDVLTETNTFAVEVGAAKGKWILRLSLESEKILLAVVLAASLVGLKNSSLILFILSLSLSVIYFAGYVYSILKIIIHKEKVVVNPFIPGEKTIFQFLHHSYPSVLLPLGLNFLLTVLNPAFLILLLLQLFMRGAFSREVLKNSFIFSALKKRS